MKKKIDHLLIDSHVHYYSNYDQDSFFMNAVANFHKYFKKGSNIHPVLMFTEGGKNNFFQKFVSGEIKFQNREFKFKKTGEAFSWSFEKGGDSLITIINGRQIISNEKIEILHLGTNDFIEDGIETKIVIEKILRSGSIAVIPWGVGKWVSKRGELVKKMVSEFSGNPFFFLGDNSARPVFWPMTEIFKQSLHSNVSILPGSDPLPIAREEKKSGSYFFSLRGTPDPDMPFHSIKNLLKNKENIIKIHGKRDGLVSFLRRQAIINFKKYL